MPAFGSALDSRNFFFDDPLQMIQNGVQEATLQPHSSILETPPAEGFQEPLIPGINLKAKESKASDTCQE